MTALRQDVLDQDAEERVDTPERDLSLTSRGSIGRSASSSFTEKLGFEVLIGVGAALLGGIAFWAAMTFMIGSPICAGGVCPEARPYIPVLIFAAVIRGATFAFRRHH